MFSRWLLLRIAIDWSRGSVVGMETRLLAGSSRHRGSIPGSGAYPALYSVGTGNAFLENEAAGA